MPRFRSLAEGWSAGGPKAQQRKATASASYFGCSSTHPTLELLLPTIAQDLHHVLKIKGSEDVRRHPASTSSTYVKSEAIGTSSAPNHARAFATKIGIFCVGLIPGSSTTQSSRSPSQQITVGPLTSAPTVQRCLLVFHAGIRILKTATGLEPFNVAAASGRLSQGKVFAMEGPP